MSPADIFYFCVNLSNSLFYVFHLCVLSSFRVVNLNFAVFGSLTV